MAYRLRDEFIGEDTRQALDDYQDAAKKRIHSKIKYYGNLYNELHRRDVLAATDGIKACGFVSTPMHVREQPCTCRNYQGEHEDDCQSIQE